MSDVNAVAAQAPDHENLAQGVALKMLGLTEDQLDFLFEIAAGESYRKIAQDFGMDSEHRVRPRLQLWLRRLGVPESFPEKEVPALLSRALQLINGLAEANKSLDAGVTTPVVVKSAVSEKPAAADPLPVPIPEISAPAVVTTLSFSDDDVAPGVIVSGRLVTIPTHRIRRFVGQPRIEFDPVQQDALTASIREVRQLMPGLVRRVRDDPHHDYEVIDGERRWISCIAANQKTYEGIEYPGLSIPDAKKQYLLSAISNFGRSQHTPLELAFTAQKIMEDNGWSLERTAASLCHSPGTITYHLRLLKLAPGAQALMRVTVPEAKRLTIANALLLVDYDLNFQVTVAGEICEKGLKGSKASWHVRSRAVQEGARPGRKRRGRRPANDARTVIRGIARIDERLAQYLDIPGLPLAEVFRERSEDEHGEVTLVIDRAIARLQAIKVAVNGV